MTGRRTPLRERAAQGDYDLIAPLDYIIMEHLTVEGTMLGEFYEIGTTVKSIVDKFPDDITVGVLGGRLRVLEAQGLTKKIRMVRTTARNSWQVTHKGIELLNAWKEGHGNHGSS